MQRQRADHRVIPWHAGPAGGSHPGGLRRPDAGDAVDGEREGDIACRGTQHGGARRYGRDHGLSHEDRGQSEHQPDGETERHGRQADAAVADGIEARREPCGGIADARKAYDDRPQGLSRQRQPERSHSQAKCSRNERGLASARHKMQHGCGTQQNGAHGCQIEQTRQQQHAGRMQQVMPKRRRISTGYPSSPNRNGSRKFQALS